MGAAEPAARDGFPARAFAWSAIIQSNPAAAAKIAADVLRSPEPLAARALSEAMRLGILDLNLNWSDVGLRRIYENMQADNTIPSDRTFDLSRIANAAYLLDAQRALPAASK